MADNFQQGGPRPSRRAALQGLGRQGQVPRPGEAGTAVGRGHVAVAAATSRSAGVFVLRDAGLRDPGTGVADRLRVALALAEPELRFKLTEATRPLRDPFRDGGEGLRDFRLAATLGRVGPAPTDLIAIEAASVPHSADRRSTLIKIRPARTSSLFAGLMAPALEGLCALTDRLDDRDNVLIALAFSAHALAAAANIEQGPAMDPASARLVERLAGLCERHAEAASSQEGQVLGAWVAAWSGLCSGETGRLEAARSALDRIANDPDADLTPRERAQIHCNIAIVGLALGGTSDGARRLSEALAAARTARGAIAVEIEAATAMDLDGLVGEIALASGLRRRDRRLLAEAEAALTAALGSGIKSSASRRWSDMRQRARNAMSGQA